MEFGRILDEGDIVILERSVTEVGKNLTTVGIGEEAVVVGSHKIMEGVTWYTLVVPGKGTLYNMGRSTFKLKDEPKKPPVEYKELEVRALDVNIFDRMVDDEGFNFIVDYIGTSSVPDPDGNKDYVYDEDLEFSGFRLAESKTTGVTLRGRDIIIVERMDGL